jgi:YidC/Oxa1 family membrane protein insertase
MSSIWNEFVVNPMLNGMLLLYQFLGNNLILAILVFTILIRLLTLPLNLRQQRSMMRTQQMQPQIQAIQKKYKDNPQKMQEEFSKIGYNPAESLTGCLPMLIQMPILFGMFTVFRIMLGTTPLALYELAERVYSGINLSAILPIDNTFLWWNLGQPDPFLVLPILVFATMFIQQKFMSPAKKNNSKGKQDDPSAAMTQSMQYTMPLMFGFFSLQFQAGLSIYFIFSNIIGILQGWYTRRVVPQPDDVADKSKSTETKVIDQPKDEFAPLTPEKKKPHKAKPPTSKRKRRSAKR